MDDLSPLFSLIALLPPAHQALLVAALPAVIGVCSLLVAALKTWVLPRMAESEFKVALLLIVSKLDWLAANSRKVRDAQEMTALKQKIAEHERTLLKRDTRIVSLAAQVHDQQRAFFAQQTPTLELVDSDILPLGEPDNDNGTLFKGGVK